MAREINAVEKRRVRYLEGPVQNEESLVCG